MSYEAGDKLHTGPLKWMELLLEIGLWEELPSLKPRLLKQNIVHATVLRELLEFCHRSEAESLLATSASITLAHSLIDQLAQC